MQLVDVKYCVGVAVPSAAEQRVIAAGRAAAVHSRRPASSHRPLLTDDMPIHDREGGGGAAAWLRQQWRALVAESLATALLVLLGLASLVSPAPVPLTHPAFAFGLVIVMLAQVFGPVSGAHMNPAISLAAVLTGYMEIPVALAYFVAQTIGAFIGFSALLLFVPSDPMSSGLGCTVPTVSPAAAAAVEGVLTGLLALLACSCWAAHDPARPDHTAPVKFGLGVAGLVYAGGHMTKASLNPVRSLAPAVFMNVWTHHWVYWVGPLGGAALAAVLHRAVLAPQPAPAAAREELPLNDKATP
ncbi:lens fiber major intrinsic protein-like [Plodia interpunctella]|uniref:lens fiber major intrinsic protein-like n=1 Tax=Plodia interpunctella TaxID=58824 RepID=UPI002367A70C|nr:lens fiber major intrinsic protein-like [Plodia interpunctella]